MSAPERAVVNETRDADALARPRLDEIGLVALRVVAVITVIVGVPHFPDAAAERFVQIAHAAGLPWRDSPVEYAFGDWLVIRAVGWGSVATARALLGVVAFTADLVAWRAVAYGWGRAAAVRYLWLGAPLLISIYRRSDLVAVALAALGLALALRGRERAGGVTLGASILVKAWPLVISPALAIERRSRALTTAAIAVATGLVGWLLLGGTDALRQVGMFRGATGWELESTIGAVVWAVTGNHRFEAGANRTGTVPGAAPPLLLLATLAVVTAIWLVARRRTDTTSAGPPALAAVAALLVFAPVFSPQYVVWLLPWAAIAGGDGRRWTRLASVPVILTGTLATLWYLDVDLGPGLNQLVLIVRNLSVLAIPIVWLWRARPPNEERTADA
jgi:Glycosyltransferase family 87